MLGEQLGDRFVPHPFLRQALVHAAVSVRQVEDEKVLPAHQAILGTLSLQLAVLELPHHPGQVGLLETFEFCCATMLEKMLMGTFFTLIWNIKINVLTVNNSA